MSANTPTTTNVFPTLTDYTPDHNSLLRDIIRVVKGIMIGNMNIVRQITLTAGSATTDVALEKDVVSAKSYIGFMPTTANAATEFGAGSLYVSTINETGSAVGGLAAYSIRITHVNNAQTDRTFRIIIVG